ncbi:MAG TPA: 1-phosphofructokinase family hexose kinase [Dyella sp.]|uniref:1-phosphofructokinase family hexose kinase n=1 Tax=Dyella sp. TaxID=1869338 RepID=UPI002C6B8E55|nr:1-phosphofructokinase family hexose kinase [Dyella sp.]HTV85801.1 1-phosphofructokinase family hexose kinase [Dyella sp.]
MIAVAGFNTAIDRFIHLDALIPGQVHRARDEQVYPGGKGVHVAQTIAALGESVQLVGLTDAPHRDLIQQRMSERGVRFHGVEVAASLRHCLALQDAGGSITEVLGQGPLLGQGEREALLRDFRRMVDESGLVILSGSVPRGFAATVYAQLIEHVNRLGKRCLVDASGEVMRHAVGAHPFLVKPNRDEISEWTGHAVSDLAAAKEALHALRAQGIAMPVVTLGEQGAIAADHSGIWHAHLAATQVRNSVGSGDCFLAGIAVALQRNQSLEHALRLGVACGVANAQSQETGFVERSCVDALLCAVQVRRLD